ncbi:MAG: thiamine-binding protein [Bacteroidales bacterium]|nr:thiamine-binding protein [Bacteroidales bacterium]
MHSQVNAAIQVLPRSIAKHPYEIVDAAIEEIKKSGLRYVVTPFETVVEGEYHQIMKLIEEIHIACYEAGAIDMICNIKIQSSSAGPVTIDDKMNKYTKA